jgi:hypothetical protein
VSFRKKSFVFFVEPLCTSCSCIRETSEERSPTDFRRCWLYLEVCWKGNVADVIFASQKFFAPQHKFRVKILALNFAALRETSEDKSNADFRRCDFCFAKIHYHICLFSNFHIIPLPLNFATLREIIRSEQR